jgi:DNA-binding LacI/PurR family transcriptional regulator
VSDPTPARRRSRGAGSTSDGITIDEVAHRAGVSVATVSRALRGLPNVAPSTRARVEEAANELDYQIDQTASRLATGRRNAVGLAVPNIGEWYSSQVAAGVEAVLAAEGHDMLLFSINDGPGRDRLLRRSSAVRRRLSSLVLIDIVLDDAEAQLLAGDADLAVVTVGQRTKYFPSVTIDNGAAAQMVTRHVLELGHRRIAVITAHPEHSLPSTASQQRLEGVRRTVGAAGIQWSDVLVVSGGFTARGGREAMTQLMSERDAPTAVFAFSDEMAVGALKTLDDLGVRVPQDVSVVGFDDHELASVFGLTTVHQDPVWQGASAARFVLGLDAGRPAGPDHVVGPTQLIARSTTGPLSPSVDEGR